MKTTPFTEIHKALGAKMHEFAGYDMPIEYPTGIIEEHMTVIKGVGVFDVSHMGEFWVKGPNALQFIQDITTNDASKLKVGDIQYTSSSTTTKMRSTSSSSMPLISRRTGLGVSRTTPLALSSRTAATTSVSSPSRVLWHSRSCSA